MKELDVIKSKLETSGMLDDSYTAAIELIDSRLKLFEDLEETLYNPDLYLVYMHTTPDGRKYIGITKSSPSTRWNEGAGYESQRKFYKAIQAFGWMNIEHRIIAAGLTETEAKALESGLIIKYRTNEAEFGYNTNLSVAQAIAPGKGNSSAKKGADVKAQPDFREVSIQLIKKYSIKTVDGRIYYISNGKYIRESEQPVLNKELLITYGISPKKHREILRMIEILSAAKKEDVFPEVSKPKSTGKTIRDFLDCILLNLSDGFISADNLYDDYLSWTSDNSIVPMEKATFMQAVTREILRSHPELEKNEQNSQKGWSMPTIYYSKNGEMNLTTRGIAVIDAWLDNTSEPIVCVSMILDQALHYSGKCPKRISNEIAAMLRNKGWEADKLKRFTEYGVQRGFVRF